tara:strand:- start:252 stop:590 length:339 start_codon:yes stop_codon:yes gene_type:complete
MWIMDKNNKTNIVDFRGPRQKTKGWSPEKKFTEFARIRVPKLLRAMKSVKNLATVYNPKTKIGYISTKNQRKKIAKDIRAGWRELNSAWENAGRKTKTNNTNKKEDYWETGE